MTRQTKALVAAIAAWLSAGLTPGHAWNHTGHMVVAQIAYERLTPAVKTRADQLVALGAEPENSTFVTAACWPDDLKSYGITLYSPLHYIDMPFSNDSTPTPAAPPDPNVRTAMEQCVKVLQNRRAPEVEKARMLRFLLHFVGDVHQPLHCVSRYSTKHPQGDRGAGDFPITGMPERNLHGLWDAGIGLFLTLPRPLNADDASSVAKLASDCAAAYPPERVPEWRDDNFQTWISESFTLARSVAYANIEEDASPSAPYQVAAAETVKKRVALAGYRLAELLNRVLGETAGPEGTQPPSTSPGTAAPQAVTLDERADGTTVHLAVGGSLTIRLASNRTTGYGWQLTRNNYKKLQSSGDPVYEQNATGPHGAGTGGHEVFRFHAVAAGRSTVEMHYVRPWEKHVPPARAFRVKIVITQ